MTPANFPRAVTVRRMANDVTYTVYAALPIHLRVQSMVCVITRWFNQCFASTLPDHCLEGVWDRLVGGCVMILVFVAVAILLTFKRRLLGARTSTLIAEALTQVRTV